MKRSHSPNNTNHITPTIIGGAAEKPTDCNQNTDSINQIDIKLKKFFEVQLQKSTEENPRNTKLYLSHIGNLFITSFNFVT